MTNLNQLRNPDMKVGDSTHIRNLSVILFARPPRERGGLRELLFNISDSTMPSRGENPGSQAGFSLIEMMIVMALIVLIFMMALPSITSAMKVSLNSTTRDLSSVVSEAYNASVLSGKVYRVAFDLKQNQYWIEVGSFAELLDTKESLEKEQMRKKFSKPTGAPKSNFSMDKQITRKKKSLPMGVSFEDILTEQSKDPIKAGMAYAHFFPHGLTEQTIIHIQDLSKHHASLAITSVVGQIDLYSRYVTREEAFETPK